MARSRRSTIRGRQGQTLIIAIMVMFILALVATIFIALVGRNLTRSERMSDTDAVAALAEAGVRYADEMLTTSEDGADWRPVPDNLAVGRKNLDPDFEWLRPWSATEATDGSMGPSGGFTRLNSGQGRFLIRVSYNPDPNEPMSKYIKIESVGRWGNVLGDTEHIGDPTQYDPTTLEKNKLRREITAYKPIGLTDYCRFITNKDDRSVDAALGVPGYKTQFGRPANDKYGVRGGPIRVNANLLWYGDYGNNPSIEIYLRGIQANDNTWMPNELMPIDGVECSGDIKVDSDPANESSRTGVKLHALIENGSGSYDDNPFDVRPSTDDDNGAVQFTTADGFYRDGRNMTDVDNRPRGVKRIEPPLVDQPDPTNTTTRYKVLTLNSGYRVRNAAGNSKNLGALGWGRGVYIGNSTDKQDDSDTLFGGVTARADWTQPGNIMTGNWKGPYYVPPAAIITLVPDDFETVGTGSSAHKQYYFTITRDDAPGGRRAIWSDPGGNPRPEWGSTIRMPYPDADYGRDVTVPGTNPTPMHIDGNGVIYAEGNIRIRGMLPPGMRLTVVSNENIYIDGNVLKYRDPAGEIDSTDKYRGADSTGGIALLARKNVVVNTTQFFAPLNNIGPDDYGTDSLTGGNSSHIVVRPRPDSALKARFEFGPFESESGSEPGSWSLFVRHVGEYGPAYINAWMNPGIDPATWGILQLNRNASGNPVFPGLPAQVWGVGDPRFGAAPPPGAGVGSSFLCDVFPMGQVNAMLRTTCGLPNVLQIALDSNIYTRSNYWMGGLAVLPMDVRIEAIIYAQEGSFFVIPGYWLNPNPADNEKAFATSGVRPAGVDQRFPFYGQAADIRIIVDGSVSENLPASISDVEDWMAHWGRIPQKYGSTAIDTSHPLEGITFLYDDHVGWPLDDQNHKPVRVDSYGRALPLTPRLPVSGSLIYFGDVM